MSAGRRIYREGRLPSGEPVRATVQGDVPVLGTQFSCQSCHGRSGLGAGEGALVVPPVSGPLLFRPAAQAQRPAYDEGTLGRALRQGIDSAGRPLDALMPRYRLSDQETLAVGAYLRSLSASFSPGVSEAEIRFATIITSDVPATSRKAMLDVLQAYFEEKVRETRIESRRPGHDPPTRGGRQPTSYRRWALDVWDLTGPSSGWDAQMEALLRGRPVFAVVGGLSGLSWKPIHDFCESHELPCLLPSTDLPGGGGDGFYSLYFSRGLFLEADLIAQELEASPLPYAVQVFRRDTPGQAAAAALGGRLRKGTSRVEDWCLERDERLPIARLRARLSEAAGAAAVLWLGRGELTGLGGLRAPGSGGRLFLSSTMLERRWEDVPFLTPVAVFVAHPYALPAKTDPALARFRIWLRARGIAAGDERIQAHAYFACLAVNEGVMHIRRHFYRDYFMDVLDHAQGLGSYLPLYASPSLGPGQRFLAKGGYLVALTRGGGRGSAAPRFVIP